MNSTKNLNLDAVTLKVIRWFYALSLPTALVISGLIFWFGKRNLDLIFVQHFPLLQQVLFGIGTGTLIGLLIGISGLHIRRLHNFRDMAFYVFRNAKPTWIDITLTSLIAGVAEELLFRGALQPLCGIWITSLLFTLAHVGEVKNIWRNRKYTSLVFILGLVLGTIFAQFGLIAAMTTHAFIDLSFLVLFKIKSKSDSRATK